MFLEYAYPHYCISLVQRGITRQQIASLRHELSFVESENRRLHDVQEAALRDKIEVGKLRKQVSTLCYPSFTSSHKLPHP